MIIDGKEVELKNIPGYEGEYAASRDGHIWSYRSKKFLKEANNGHGYLYILLYHNGKNKHHYIHRLVALTFIPNPNNLTDVDHINRIRGDNRVENLRWVSSSDNHRNISDEEEERRFQKLKKAQARAKELETWKIVVEHKKKPVVRIDINTRKETVYPSVSEAARALGDEGKQGNISSCCLGKLKSAYGSLWRFTKEVIPKGEDDYD